MINKMLLNITNIIKKKGGQLNIGPNAYLIWNKIKISGSENNIIILGSGKLRRCTISIKGVNNRIEIEDGANVSFSSLEIVGNNCLIYIGKKTDIGGAYLSAKGYETQLVIGSNCMLSRNINIMTYDGHPIFDCESKKQINQPKNINIKNNVWIAANASILKGVTVEDNSIIGFGSVVTTDIVANSIYAGVPAKKIKENIYWEH